LTEPLGAFGENWAVGHLSRLGYSIIDRNVRYRQGEIDIVAQQGQELVFVEVKTRRSSRFGSPEASITQRRYGRLVTAIQEYLAEKGLEDRFFRIDVVAIEIGPDGRVRRGEVLENVEPPAG